MKPRRRQRPAPAPITLARRTYSDQDRVRIAYLAGQGCSAAEISDAIGGTTPERIYAYLSRNGLALVPKPPAHVAFVVRTARVEFDRLVVTATNLGAEPADVAGRLLSAVLDEPVLLRNLIDDHLGE